MIAFHLCFILGEPADSSEHKGVNVKKLAMQFVSSVTPEHCSSIACDNDNYK